VKRKSRFLSLNLLKTMPKNAKVYKTKSAFAGALGKPPDWFTRWYTRPDWPVSKSGPWTDDDVATVKAYVDKKIGERAGTEDGAGTIGERLKIEQMILTRVRRELLQGKYIDADIHTRAVVAVGLLFVRELDTLVARLPALVEKAALDGPGEVEKVLRSEFDAVRRRLAESPAMELGRAEAASKKKRQPGRKKAGAKRK
jgi:hypothetical protein